MPARSRRMPGPELGLAVIVVGLAAAALDCDRGATGVDACKRIEAKRCEAGMGCTERLADEDDVVSCRLFYQDQCLFGMADGANPDEVATEQCLAAIDQAASCKGAENLAACATPPALAAGVDPEAVTACALIVDSPQSLLACSFLLPPPEPAAGGGGAGATGGEGGAAGAGGAAGGAGGSGPGGAGAGGA